MLLGATLTLLGTFVAHAGLCAARLSQSQLNIWVASRWLEFGPVSGPEIRISEVEGQGRTVASLSVTLSAEGTVAVMGSATVHPEFRRSGLYRALYHQLLLSHPEIQEIHTGFLGTNEDIVAGLLRSGTDLVSAVRRTPFYRVASGLGFEIDPSRTTVGMGVSVVMSRKLMSVGPAGARAR